MRLAAVVALVLAAAAAPLSAQVTSQPPPPRPPQQQQTPPKTTRETVLERLRTMGVEPSRDTTKADSLKNQPRPAPGPRAPGTGQNVAPPTFQRDSLMQALLSLEGFTATEYKAIAARFNADSGGLLLRARPDSQAAVIQAGQSMTADSLLTYNRNTFLACGFGKPVLTGEGAEAPVQSERVCYNTRTRVGTAMSASTRVSEGANWIVGGNLHTSEADLYIDHARFTDCTLEYPHYHFSAGEIKVVKGDVLVARNVTLNFGDVPVFWLPFMMQSLKQGRRSGILMPEFSVNDIVRRSSRYNRRISNVGFYWAASEYMGAKLAFGWFNNNWTQLDGSLDYRFADKFLDGAVTWRQYWPSAGGKQSTIAATNSWQPDERTSLNANVSYASSSQFVKQSTFDPRELNRSIDSNLNLNRRFDWGSVSFGGSRKQYLADNKVDLALPSLSLNLSPITLFAATGEERWYNNATWTGNSSVRYSTARVDETLTPSGFDRDDVSGNASSSFSMGRFSWSQAFDMRRGTQHARIPGLAEDGDSIFAAPHRVEQLMNWNTGLSFQQRLIGTSTITPGVSMRGGAVRDTLTGVMVNAPMRLDANASLKIDFFGFWPGAGPLERIRHRLSPTFGYSYSPAVRADSLQTRVYGAPNSKEQNRLTIGLSQTIEGKFKGDPARDSAAAADTMSLDPDQPRRLPQARKVTLLSLNTDAVIYDFVEAREGYGVQTTQISNSVNSDLLRGLQIGVTHDLFHTFPLAPDAPRETRPEREFAPHLSRVTASFSLNGGSWLFRALGLSGGQENQPAAGTTPATPVPETPQAGPGAQGVGPDLGLIGRRNQPLQTPGPRGAVGSWNASFNYTLYRPRATEMNSEDNQMVTANLMFQPTENWNVTWNTGYSFTDRNFTDHVLTLTRQLHDWDANFDFVKAQNGNFSFQFRVALRANPDIKFDYDQRSNNRRPAGFQ